MHRILILVALVGGMFIGYLYAEHRAATTGAEVAQADPSAEAVAALHELFDDAWEQDLDNNPVYASYFGDRRANDRWADISPEGIESRHQDDVRILERLRSIDRSALPADEQLNYDLFADQYADRVDDHAFRQFLIPLNQRGGIQTAHEIADSLRFTSEQDFRDWLSRMRALDTQIANTISLMRTGIEERRVLPSIIMERIPGQISAQVVDDPADSPFYDRFRAIPETVDADVADALRGEARAVIADVVVPAYGRFLNFVENEYLPASFPEVGAWQLPDGKTFYANQVADYTTTDLTADEIHEIGLSEVARIRAEMEAIRVELGFDGDLDALFGFMRTDPQFYYQDPQDLLDAYRAFSKRMDPELVKLFGKIPRAPYGVKPIPEISAPDTTTAYYNRPAADGSRPGWYYVNLYRPETRPKYEIPALSLHEAVPGHHFQIALAQELGDLPRFRRYGGFTAFIEGWGLYAESLGEEMGFYDDPYDKLGQLTYEMWRAVRLVVDTGMHHKRWTRQQAIDFFKANAPKSEHDIINEIDRYIAWPGQALAYKIGELKIKELRARAQDRLGEDFDIRSFHDELLSAGALPLDILERRMERWMARQESASEG